MTHSLRAKLGNYLERKKNVSCRVLQDSLNKSGNLGESSKDVIGCPSA